MNSGFQGHFKVKVKSSDLENFTIEIGIQKYVRMVIIYLQYFDNNE